jgi:hypothetical protein
VLSGVDERCDLLHQDGEVDGVVQAKAHRSGRERVSSALRLCKDAEGETGSDHAFCLEHPREH